MSLRHRSPNFAVLLIGILSLGVAIGFLALPNFVPAATIQITTSTINSSSSSTSTTATTTSTIYYTYTCNGQTYTEPPYTMPIGMTCTTSSTTTTTTTPPCLNCAQPPAYWLDAIIATFALVGVILILRGLSLI